MDIPIVCTLTETQLRERRRQVLEPFHAKTHRSEELPHGYAYTFEASNGLLVNLAELVDLERQCCRFLTFQLTVTAADNSIRLEITGPQKAKTTIAEFFGT